MHGQKNIKLLITHIFILPEDEPYSSVSLCPSHNTMAVITPYSYLNIIPFQFKFLAVKIIATLSSFT